MNNRRPISPSFSRSICPQTADDELHVHFSESTFNTLPERIHTESVYLNRSECDLFLVFGSEYGVEQVPDQFVVLEVSPMRQGAWFMAQRVVVRGEYQQPFKKNYSKVPSGWWWRLISYRGHQGAVRVAVSRRT